MFLESEEEKTRMYENGKTGKNSDTYLKRKLRNLLGCYNESNYDADKLVLQVANAISRAETLDKNKDDRWPQGLGTHVYRLAQSILPKS